jgi:Helicase HerA, central domain
MRTGTLEVRGRLPAAIVGLGVFMVLGRWFDPHFFHTVTFGIGVATTVSATFLEPFFTRPQDALLNAAAGVVAYIAIPKSPEQSLWAAYLAFLAMILCGALAATVIRDDSNLLKWLGRRFSSTFGRAVVVGPTALVLDALTRAARGEHRLTLLMGGIAVLTASVAVNWGRLFRQVMTPGLETAVALAAVGPRMLLASASHGALEPGVPVEVVGEGRVPGTIVARLPHQQGARYQIALDEDWNSLCPSFPAEVEISVREEPSPIIGSVGEGSTDVTIEFGPLRPLRIGAPVALEAENGTLLYQVASLRLQIEAWAGSSSVVPHATARQIGLPQGGYVVATDYLPAPHEPVRELNQLAADLPEGFFRIGRVKGTAIPIGIRLDYLLRGHLAILGMSGMGKTAVAERIATELGLSEMVVALDLTGEYSRRLGFPEWQGNLDATGRSVLEPVGDPPLRAAALVNQLMQHAGQEYNAGQAPPGRNVLLEEAHSFIPEWNFATPDQRASVNDTTRMVMQARKYGLRFIIVSQRTAVVSKSALSQCDNYVVFRTIDHTGLEYIESLAGAAFRETLSNLRRYEALCMGPAFNSDQPVLIELDPPNAVAVAATGAPTAPPAAAGQAA